MANGMNPRASLVLRKNLTKQLNLQHYGIGDKMAKVSCSCVFTSIATGWTISSFRPQSNALPLPPPLPHSHSLPLHTR